MTKSMKKQEDQVQAADTVAPIPIPQRKKPTRLLQAEVDLDLFMAVYKEMTRRGLYIKDVATWGLKAFLVSTNPAEAKKLGISEGE